MKTTIDLPEDLINQTMKATHIETKTKVIPNKPGEDNIRQGKPECTIIQ